MKNHMKRRPFMQMMGLGIAGSCVSCTGSNPENNDIRGSRPNIIFILTDDQGYGDLGCYGHPYVQTPNLDKLHTQSTRLTDYHVSPTCAPTRSALMTGNAPFKNGVTHTILERERMTLDTTTIAEVLKNAGYTTGIFGKWHLGDEDPYQPHNRGFDEVFIHGGGGIGQAYAGSCADAPDNKYFDPVIRHNNTFVKTEGFCTDIFFNQALRWINTPHDKPFFAYISTNAPHAPLISPDSYREPYDDKSDDKDTASFYGMITNIDDNVGQLMDKLDEWGLTENTLLVFMTDNGPSPFSDFNAGMAGRKGTVHEGGTRVPAFFRLPGKLAAGRDIDRLTRHVDIFPTFADIAGADMGTDVDGRSLLSLLEDPQSAWEDRYECFHVGRWGKAGTPNWDRGHCDPDKAKYENFAVRNERWRLVGTEELYDIENDPGEKTNVIDQHPEIAKEMLDAYDRWWDEVRPLMVNEDVPLAADHPFHVLYEQQKQSTGIPDWEPMQL
jgi:arylsulfatase A-like enzyme